MKTLDHFRYEVWPHWKVRGTYFLLALRYGGMRRIPSEVVARQLAKSVERMERNLRDALRAMPDDVNEEERRLLTQALARGQELKDAVDTLHVEKPGDRAQ